MTESRKGAWCGFAAYLLWGVFPLYFRLLDRAGAMEILAHRIVWSLLLITVVVLIGRNWTAVRTLFRDRRTLGLLTAASVLIGINWGTFIYAVNAGFVVETSLGYFITPLVSVVAGVALFRERLRRLQWLAVSIAALGVIVLTVDYGRPPFLAIVLATSFGIYGIIKKLVPTSATLGLGVESAVLVIPALITLVVLESNGSAQFGPAGWWFSLLLVSSGVLTAIPLLLFAAAARRVKMTTLGLLQYITPTMQFLLGVTVFGESMPLGRLLGFCVVWAALVVFSLDGLLTYRSTARTQRVAAAESAGEPALVPTVLPVEDRRAGLSPRTPTG